MYLASDARNKHLILILEIKSKETSVACRGYPFHIGKKYSEENETMIEHEIGEGIK